MESGTDSWAIIMTDGIGTTTLEHLRGGRIRLLDWVRVPLHEA
jgi:hypothetical protein